MSKDWKQLIAAIEQAGGEVVLRKAGHYRITGPGGHYFTSGTPGDWRSRMNLVSGLRKVGIDIRGRR